MGSCAAQGATLRIMERIGRIETVDIRDAWRHEAHGFTRWLFDNLDVLGDAIGIELTGTRREAPTASFNLDVLAEDASGNIVVIENQFGNSDHDHLGKVLTYLASFDAAAAVWIVEKARSEHVAAISWLNESAASAEFFLVQIEVIRIGDSLPAPRFTVIVQPSEQLRRIGIEKREVASRHAERHAFWTELLKVSRERHHLHAGVSPNETAYLVAGSGVSGLTFAYTVLEHSMRVELYISRGDEESSERVFHSLEAHKSEIEDAFGQALVWQPMPGRKSCRVKHDLDGGGRLDREEWPQIIRAAVDAMVRLEVAIRPHLPTIHG